MYRNSCLSKNCYLIFPKQMKQCVLPVSPHGCHHGYMSLWSPGCSPGRGRPERPEVLLKDPSPEVSAAHSDLLGAFKTSSGYGSPPQRAPVCQWGEGQGVFRSPSPQRILPFCPGRGASERDPVDMGILTSLLPPALGSSPCRPGETVPGAAGFSCSQQPLPQPAGLADTGWKGGLEPLRHVPCWLLEPAEPCRTALPWRELPWRAALFPGETEVGTHPSLRPEVHQVPGLSPC